MNPTIKTDVLLYLLLIAMGLQIFFDVWLFYYAETLYEGEKSIVDTWSAHKRN